jgi:hypothetical protein
LLPLVLAASVHYIPLVKLGRVLTETLLALLACKDLSFHRQIANHAHIGTGAYHLGALLEHVRLALGVAFGAVKPFPAWISSVSSL